jgi:hypothetical protein
MKLNFTLPLRVEIRNFLLYSMGRSEGEGNVGKKEMKMKRKRQERIMETTIRGNCKRS